MKTIQSQPSLMNQVSSKKNNYENIRQVPEIVRRSEEKYQNYQQEKAAHAHPCWNLKKVKTVVKHNVVVLSKPSKISSKSQAHRDAMRAIAGGAVPSLKPTFTRVRQSCVVGVRQAAFRLCLRRIRRGQIPQLNHVVPKVRQEPITDTRQTSRKQAKANAHNQTLRLIFNQQFPQLNHVNTRVKHQCVVGVKEAANRLCLRAIRRGEIPQLNHVVPKEHHNPIITKSRRQTARTQTLRAISTQQFDLKPAFTRVTTTPVVTSRSSKASAHRAAMRAIASTNVRATLRPMVTRHVDDVVVLNGFRAEQKALLTLLAAADAKTRQLAARFASLDQNTRNAIVAAL